MAKKCSILYYFIFTLFCLFRAERFREEEIRLSEVALYRMHVMQYILIIERYENEKFFLEFSTKYEQ